jgi:acetylornithine/LysW-gamma-L-lysine aminotransferase
MGNVEFVDYDDPDALAAAVDEETAAVIVEPIQGEGGINPASRAFLQRAREATTDAGAALVFDEVQTGMGRTGTIWACEKAGVVPDMLTSAKGLGNGFPVGTTLCRDWIAENYGSHASTFSGGPVISAAAEATVSTLVERDVPGNASEVGEYLQGQLAERLGDSVREVRGEGLMVGIEVRRGSNRVLRDLALDHGVLALPAGRTVVRLLPPLTIGREQADEVVDALETVLG